MEQTQPSQDEWRRLYAVAGQVKALAPWEWMLEDDMFGVKNPETGELGFVSIMGNLGEHLAVAVYLGAEALYRFWEMQEAGEMIAPQFMFETAQLQASFEDREQLDQADRDVIKSLGLKFRGRQSWPMFRSFQPGYFPWRVDASEARWLTYILEQVLDVAPRLRDDEDLLYHEDSMVYLVREATREDDKLVWADTWLRVPPPEGQVIEATIEPDLAEAVSHLKRGNLTVELDLFMLPTPIHERPSRPFFPYNLLCADTLSSAVLGFEMMTPVPSLEAMWGEVPAALARVLVRLGQIPKEVRVADPLLTALLTELSQVLKFKLTEQDSLPTLDMVKEMMLTQFGRGGF